MQVLPAEDSECYNHTQQHHSQLLLFRSNTSADNYYWDACCVHLCHKVKTVLKHGT